MIRKSRVIRFDVLAKIGNYILRISVLEFCWLVFVKPEFQYKIQKKSKISVKTGSMKQTRS